MNKLHTTIVSLLALGLAAPAFAAPEVKTKGGFEIKDGDFSFKFGGRLMLDYVEPMQDVTPMGASLFFRRARLEFSGTMFKDWQYSAEFDFAEKWLDPFEKKAQEAWDAAKKQPVRSGVVAGGGLLMAAVGIYLFVSLDVVGRIT